MAVYTANANDGLTVRVDYADPAGGFAGWFLHTLNDIGFAPISSSGDAATMAGWFDGASGTGTRQAQLHASIKERLVQMFGTDASVRWSVTILESITPAVIDDNW